MSVVCRTLGAPNMDAYVKGAPETVASFCQLQTGQKCSSTSFVTGHSETFNLPSLT